jgi:hypothetical protein
MSFLHYLSDLQENLAIRQWADVDLSNRQLDQTLHDLHFLLEVLESQEHPIRLLHPSFHDFLLSKQRCHDQHF